MERYFDLEFKYEPIKHNASSRDFAPNYRYEAQTYFYFFMSKFLSQIEDYTFRLWFEYGSDSDEGKATGFEELTKMLGSRLDALTERGKLIHEKTGGAPPWRNHYMFKRNHDFNDDFLQVIDRINWEKEFDILCNDLAVRISYRVTRSFDRSGKHVEFNNTEDKSFKGGEGHQINLQIISLIKRIVNSIMSEPLLRDFLTETCPDAYQNLEDDMSQLCDFLSERIEAPGT
jgi:hypothetical protein